MTWNIRRNVNLIFNEFEQNFLFQKDPNMEKFLDHVRFTIRKNQKEG